MKAAKRKLILLLLMLFAPYKHQARPQDKGADQTLKLGTELIVLDAQALTRKTGSPVTGLSREDFILTEDGVRQQITNFSFDTAPLSIILLLDVSGSVQPIIDQIRDRGLEALQRLKPADEVAIVAFGRWVELVQEFTGDRKLIEGKIGEIAKAAADMKSATFIDEALYESASHLLKSARAGSSRVVITVTDNIQSPNAAGHTRTEALERIFESGATVCGLVVGDFDLRASVYKQRGIKIDDPLGFFSSETGGLLLKTKREDAGDRLRDLIDRLRTRYSFGYVSTNQKHDRKLRRIRLKVKDEIEKREGGVDVITRRGYYAK